MKIRFLQAYKVRDDEGREYKAGAVEDMSEASALHFITRGVAEEFTVENDEAPARGRRRSNTKEAADADDDTGNGADG